MFWGCLCAVALLGVAGVDIACIVIGAVMRSWLLLGLSVAAGAAWAVIFALSREREPRERREVQKGARWP